MENTTNSNGKGFWKRTADFLFGPIEEPSEQRSETPLYLGEGSAVLPRSNDSTVSGAQAMGLIGVYRAVSIVSTAAKQLPVGVWRGGVEIDAPALIKQPNIDITRVAFVEQTVTSLALHGNAYWLLNRTSPSEAVNNVEVLNPSLMFVETDEKTGKVKQYRYGDKTYPVWKVKHLRLLRTPGSHYGLGPIQAAQASLRGAIDLREYSANWFRDGGVPNGILKTEQQIEAGSADAIKARFMATQSDGRGVAVLGNGVSYQPIYLSPADAQFIESQGFTKTEVATLFGIPAIYMLADGGNSMTYTNSIQVDIAFVRYTLTQYLTEIEQAFSELLPRGQDARFVVEGLLRADQKTRFEGYAIAPHLTINEIRGIEGLPPIAGGDALAMSAPAPSEPSKEAQQA